MIVTQEQIQKLAEKLKATFKMSDMEARREAVKLIRWQRGPRK